MGIGVERREEPRRQADPEKTDPQVGTETEEPEREVGAGIGDPIRSRTGGTGVRVLIGGEKEVRAEIEGRVFGVLKRDIKYCNVTALKPT